MFGKVNPAQIQGMMKKMGISQQPLDVRRVIFEMEDGNLVIDDPSVMKVSMAGQENYQVSGETRKEEDSAFSDADVDMVKEKTGKSEEEVREALEESEGDIAEAIMKLS